MEIKNIGLQLMGKKHLLCMFFWMIVVQKHVLIGHGVFQEIVNHHTRAFDCKNLYEKPLDAVALRKWQNVIVNVGDFLANTAQKQKTLLMDYFSEMHKINRDLINTIKKSYTAKSNQIIDIHTHQRLSHTFQKIEKRARYIQKSLYWVDDTDVADAQAIECAQRLAQFIAATARKARLNLS
jgi:hypothetical protein